MVLVSAIFLKKIGSRTHRVTKNLTGEGKVLFQWQEKEVPECRSSLCLSDTDILEWRSDAFHHKNTFGISTEKYIYIYIYEIISAKIVY
jgi:hypothetical protein